MKQTTKELLNTGKKHVTFNEIINLTHKLQQQQQQQQ